MRVITIGRDSSQDICYDNEMISRRHAILRIYNSGKMEIVSLGQNGTFVNGNLCKPNANYPLKRNDVVSFAHVCELDWKQVPNPLKWLKIVACVVGITSFLSVAAVLLYMFWPFGPNVNDAPIFEKTDNEKVSQAVPTDTLLQVKPDAQEKSSAVLEKQTLKDTISAFFPKRNKKTTGKTTNQSTTKNNPKQDKKQDTIKTKVFKNGI